MLIDSNSTTLVSLEPVDKARARGFVDWGDTRYYLYRKNTAFDNFTVFFSRDPSATNIPGAAGAPRRPRSFSVHRRTGEKTMTSAIPTDWIHWVYVRRSRTWAIVTVATAALGISISLRSLRRRQAGVRRHVSLDPVLQIQSAPAAGPAPGPSDHPRMRLVEDPPGTHAGKMTRDGAPIPLPALIRKLGAERRRGVLEVTAQSGPMIGRIDFEDGQVTYASCPLGNMDGLDAVCELIRRKDVSLNFRPNASPRRDSACPAQKVEDLLVEVRRRLEQMQGGTETRDRFI